MHQLDPRTGKSRTSLKGVGDLSGEETAVVLAAGSKVKFHCKSTRLVNTVPLSEPHGSGALQYGCKQDNENQRGKPDHDGLHFMRTSQRECYVDRLNLIFRH